MCESHAAHYLGISVSTFRDQVRKGNMPAPVRITPGRVVWDRQGLDRFADNLSRAEDDWADMR